MTKENKCPYCHMKTNFRGDYSQDKSILNDTEFSFTGDYLNVDIYILKDELEAISSNKFERHVFETKIKYCPMCVRRLSNETN